MHAVSYAVNPTVLRRGRDLYSAYMASCNGLNYQGLPCPAWDSLTEAVRGHWYVVALRSLQLAPADASAERGMCEATELLPNDYVLQHLPEPTEALKVWASYSGIELP